MSFVEISKPRPHVSLITLNRPERNNAWTHALEEAYFASLIAAANDPSAAALKTVDEALTAFNDEAQTLVSDVQTTC